MQAVSRKSSPHTKGCGPAVNSALLKASNKTVSYGTNCIRIAFFFLSFIITTVYVFALGEDQAYLTQVT